MEYSVDRVIQLLKDKGLTVRPGTVINYRAKLSSFGIIENNQSLTDVHIATLERIVASKTDETSWERLMSQFIYQDFSSQIKVEFEWGMKTVTEHLIWAIQNKKYKVYTLNSDDEEDFHIFCCCIDNFVELGRHSEPFSRSQGTDGNPILSYKIVTKDGSTYYTIGKLNAFTGEEEMQIFFNEVPDFNIMRCRYIGGRTSSEYDELLKVCYENREGTTEV